MPMGSSSLEPISHWPDTMTDYAAILPLARQAALDAWELIADFRDRHFDVFHKPDGPVTEADRMADRFLVERLEGHFPRGPRWGYLTEETEDDPDRFGAAHVWINDPIDGTKYFARGEDGFAMHVGLAARSGDGRHRAVLGVVYHPTAGLLYEGAQGVGAFVRRVSGGRVSDAHPLGVSGRAGAGGLRLVVSGSRPGPRLAAFLRDVPFESTVSMGSLGLKAMEVATGRADIYVNPEFGKACEWDLCAPHAILAEAGGDVFDLLGNEILYCRPNPRLDHGIVAGNRRCTARVIEAARKVPEIAGYLGL